MKGVTGMPMYEYQCQKCGYVLEKIMKHNDPAPTCPDAIETERERLPDPCGGEMKKLISKSSFQLKGSCWEKDGYASKEKKK